MSAKCLDLGCMGNEAGNCSLSDCTECDDYNPPDMCNYHPTLSVPDMGIECLKCDLFEECHECEN